jgi:hypothetical protein
MDFKITCSKFSNVREPGLELSSLFFPADCRRFNSR